MKKTMFLTAFFSVITALSVTAQGNQNSKTQSNKDLPVTEKNVGVNRGANTDRTGAEKSLPSKEKASMGQSKTIERRNIYEGNSVRKPIQQ